jgi:hypothetical protein
MDWNELNEACSILETQLNALLKDGEIPSGREDEYLDIAHEYSRLHSQKTQLMFSEELE